MRCGRDDSVLIIVSVCVSSAVCTVPVGSEDQPSQHPLPPQRQPRVPAPNRVLHLQTGV